MTQLLKYTKVKICSLKLTRIPKYLLKQKKVHCNIGSSLLFRRKIQKMKKQSLFGQKRAFLAPPKNNFKTFFLEISILLISNIFYLTEVKSHNNCQFYRKFAKMCQNHPKMAKLFFSEGGGGWSDKLCFHFFLPQFIIICHKLSLNHCGAKFLNLV